MFLEKNGGDLPVKVSIIICVWKDTPDLRVTMENALEPDSVCKEVIVVDNGTTERTIRELVPFRGSIRYIHKKDAAIAEERNVGIEASHGEYIQFLDPEDMLGKGVLQGQAAFLDANSDTDISVCPTKTYSRISRKNKPVKTAACKMKKKFLDIHLCHFNIAPPVSCLFRKSIFTDLGGYDTGLKACEDSDFLSRAVFNGKILRFHDEKGFAFHKKVKNVNHFAYKQERLYDFLLHRRIAKRLRENSGYPASDPGAGYLACASGALVTASRLFNMGLDGYNELIVLAEELIRESIHTHFAPGVKKSNPAYVYFLEIRICLTFPAIKRQEEAGQLKSAFRELCEAWEISGSGFILFVKTIFQGIFCSFEDSALRASVFKFPFRLLFSRFVKQ